MKLIWGGQHMAGMKYFMQNTYTVLTLVNANFRCNRYDFASSKTINNIYMYWGNEVIFKCIIGHQMTNWFLPFVLMLKKIFKCAKMHWLCCCNLKCSMYFCCTCFSMGDLGVQVSVRLFIHPSVRPSTFTMGVLWAQLLLQFFTDLFETLQMLSSWCEDVHVVWI